MLVAYLLNLKEEASEKLLYSKEINPYLLGEYRETIQFANTLIDLVDFLDAFKEPSEAIKNKIKSYTDI